MASSEWFALFSAKARFMYAVAEFGDWAIWACAAMT
jgi:hypothetical protein